MSSVGAQHLSTRTTFSSYTLPKDSKDTIRHTYDPIFQQQSFQTPGCLYDQSQYFTTVKNTESFKFPRSDRFSTGYLRDAYKNKVPVIITH